MQRLVRFIPCVLLVFAPAALSLSVAGCGSTPRPSPVPEIEEKLEQGQRQFDGHQYRRAREEFARALVHSETEDNLYGQAVCYLSLARCHQRLGESRDALRMFAAAERVMALLGERSEQPNVVSQDLDILYGRFYEMQASIYTSRRQWDEARRALDRAADHYQKAR